MRLVFRLHGSDLTAKPNEFFPNMKRSARARLGQDMGQHMGRTLFEIYHDAEFQTQHHKFSASGPGLAALKEAQAAGKGAIIVSGHFGQWEAVRAVIKMHGLESGAVYRPHKKLALRTPHSCWY